MDKIAILILGANAPKILGRVLAKFIDPRFKIFLHVDAKIDLKTYQNEAQNLELVNIIKSRTAVFWGGFSMIEAELALIKAALEDPEVSGFTFWSDDTVPLRAPDAVYESLQKTPDRIACEVLPHVQRWYRQFYFVDSKFTNPVKGDVNERNFGARDLLNIERMQRLVEIGKQKIERVYFSRQWISLSRTSAEAVLKYADENDHLVESFRFSLFPDEIFFPTIYKFCFPDTVAGVVPVYANYGSWPAPQAYGRREEIPAPDRVPNHLFLRKIQSGQVGLVDFITQRW